VTFLLLPADLHQNHFTVISHVL